MQPIQTLPLQCCRKCLGVAGCYLSGHLPLEGPFAKFPPELAVLDSLCSHLGFPSSLLAVLITGVGGTCRSELAESPLQSEHHLGPQSWAGSAWGSVTGYCPSSRIQASLKVILVWPSCLMVMPGGTQGLLLTLYSGTIPSKILGTIWDAVNPIWVDHVQSKCPICYNYCSRPKEKLSSFKSYAGLSTYRMGFCMPRKKGMESD